MINSLIYLKCHNTVKNYEAKFTEHKTKHMNTGIMAIPIFDRLADRQTDRQTGQRE